MLVADEEHGVLFERLAGAQRAGRGGLMLAVDGVHGVTPA